MTTKCDIIRAAARAQQGHCVTEATPTPADPDIGACAVIQRATDAARYTQARFNPRALASGISRTIREREMGAFQHAMTSHETLIRGKFGENAPTDITWADFTKCLQNPDGTPGYGGAKYYDRNALEHHLGYLPMPALGAMTFFHALPPVLTNQVPIWFDSFLNPDLAVIAVFVLIVLLVAVLAYSALQWKKGAPKRAAAAREAQKERIDAVDPMSGTDFPTSGPKKSSMEIYVEGLEAEGTDMTAERKQYGLAPLAG
jgi:hypothetical protein